MPKTYVEALVGEPTTMSWSLKSFFRWDRSPWSECAAGEHGHYQASDDGRNQQRPSADEPDEGEEGERGQPC